MKKNPYITEIIPTEEREQQDLFIEVGKLIPVYPALKLLYAIPNGGYRHQATANRLKATGVKAGVPDMCLPVPRGEYHGMYIELKRRKGGQLSEYQKWWIERLKEEGYMVVVARGCDEALQYIIDYLETDEE